MSEKLCLHWNDFKENINSTFEKLREDKEFTDVTLVCEDGQLIEGHKVILATLSPFFENILQKSKHPHPLIYLKGFQSKDLASILDFLYFGEANVYQEDLDSFLAIAEEIKLKGLTGQTSSEVLEEPETPKPSEPASMKQESFKESYTCKRDQIPNGNVLNDDFSSALSILNQSNTDTKALDEKVKSLMVKGQKMIPTGKHTNGTPRQEKSSICKVCGKEGRWNSIRDHIESNHLDGIFLPCNHCDKTYQSRYSLGKHKRQYHK